jgi:hypothetical protein
MPCQPALKQKRTTKMDLTASRATIRVNPIPMNEIAPWAIFSLLILILFYYFIGAEQGATSLVSGNQVHEFVHDARHLLGFPCH